MTVKTKKQSNRSADGTKPPPGQHVRAARIAIDADGNEHRVEAQGGNAWVLPEGMRWLEK